MNRFLNVMIVEDSEDDALLLLRELRNSGYKTSHRLVDTPEAMREALATGKWDVILSDFALPRFSGIAALEILKESGLDLPFIVVSGKIGEETAVQLMKAGAHDYIVKGNLARLAPAVEREMQEAEDRRMLREAEAALKESEARYRCLLDSVTDYIYSVEIENNQPVTSSHGPGCRAVTGYSPEEFAADPLLWYRMVHEEDRPRVLEQARAVLSGHAWSLEHRILHKNGTIRWVRNTPVLRKDRRVQAYGGLIFDITELKALIEVSLTLCRTIDMEMLLSEVLHTLTEMDIFRFERKGAAFLVEEDRLRIAASVGLTDADLNSCKNLRFGECLCGLAASTGEILISENFREDSRHLTCLFSADSHGQVILPLKTVNTVVGVLCIHTWPEMEINERELTLLSSLGNQIGIAVSNAKLYEEARSFSLHDSLTGLQNRRSLQLQLEKSIETANRYGEGFSVIMLDIDHFKHYNDLHGHIEGDRLLVRLAGVLLHEMRKPDYIFRYGGEEFLVILPATDSDKTCEAAERMRKAVEVEEDVTISLGIASYREGMQDSVSLIRSADAALYRAKQLGRNRVETED